MRACVSYVCSYVHAICLTICIIFTYMLPFYVCIWISYVHMFKYVLSCGYACLHNNCVWYAWVSCMYICSMCICTRMLYVRAMCMYVYMYVYMLMLIHACVNDVYMHAYTLYVCVCYTHVHHMCTFILILCVCAVCVHCVIEWHFESHSFSPHVCDLGMRNLVNVFPSDISLSNTVIAALTAGKMCESPWTQERSALSYWYCQDYWMREPNLRKSKDLDRCLYSFRALRGLDEPTDL